MGVALGVRFGHESPRGHTHSGGQWLSLRSADRQPSSFHRYCRRANSACHGFRERGRRHHKADAGVHQAPVRSAWTFVSSALGMYRGRRTRLKNEPSRRAIVAIKAVQPGQYGHLGAYMPRCSACQKAPLLVGWQLFNPIQVQFDARRQRRLRVLEGRAVGGDVEIGADRMPLLTALAGITSQCLVHSGSLLKTTVICDQRTTGSLLLPEPPWTAWGTLCRTE